MDHTALGRDDIYGDMSFHQTMKPHSPIKPTRKNYDYSQKFTTNRLNHQTFETMEENIDEYIRNIDKQPGHKPTIIDDINLDIDLDMLISQSHQVISQIPTSIRSFQEGDHHIKALSNCISKILAQVEIDKHQVSKLKIDNHQLNTQIKNLQFENNRLNLSNEDDVHQKQELAKKNQDLKQRMKNKIDESNQVHLVNENLVQENKLLREKLVKYRDLYQSEKSKSVTKAGTANEPSVSESEKSKNFKAGTVNESISVSELLNQLIHAVNGKKYLENISPPGPTPTQSVEPNDIPEIKNNNQMNRKVTTNDENKENNKENNINNNYNTENNFANNNHHENEIRLSTSSAALSDQAPNPNFSDASEANDLQEEDLIEKVVDLLKKKNERIMQLQQLSKNRCDCQLPICSTCKANGHLQLNNETLHIAGEYKWVL